MAAPKSYRPVMLLSVVHNVLTPNIIISFTTIDDLFCTSKPSGFTLGRPTADGVLYTRVMCERSLLGDRKYFAALIDSSGAFDTFVCEKALARLSDRGAGTDILTTLISDTMVRVKLSSASHSGKALATDIGVLQWIRSLPACIMCMLREPYCSFAIARKHKTQSSQQADDHENIHTDVNWDVKHFNK